MRVRAATSPDHLRLGRQCYATVLLRPAAAVELSQVVESVVLLRCSNFLVVYRGWAAAWCAQSNVELLECANSCLGPGGAGRHWPECAERFDFGNVQYSEE